MADRPLDLTTLQRLVSELSSAKTSLAKAQRLVDSLEMKNGKTGVSLSLTLFNDRGGDREEHAFRVIDADLYSHRISNGREPVLRHLQRFAHEQRIAWAGKVEGLEFQIRRLTKGGTP